MKRFLNFLCMISIFSMHACIGAALIPGLVQDEETSHRDTVASIVIKVYGQVQQDFNKEIVVFSQALQDSFQSLTDADDDQAVDSIEKFNAKTNAQLQKSIKVINRISDNSLKQYYDEMKKAGISFTLGVTDPVARKLQRDLNSIEYDVIYDMKVAVEKVQFIDTLDEINQEIQSAKAAFLSKAEQDYALAQAAASQKRKVTAWKEYKIAGKDFLGRFQDAAEQECKAAVVQAVNETLDQLGQAAMDALTDNVDKLAKQTMESIAKSIKFDMDFGTDYLGEQLSAKLQKYTSQQVQDLVEKLPNYLKKEAFKRAGINEDEDTMVGALKAVIRKQYPVKQKFDGLQVRQSTALAEQEIEFVKNRMPKVTAALEKNFDVTAPLKIGLCTSGGGNRAMLVTLGFHLGAQEIGLLDSILYTAGVSGSTWTISGWSYLYASMAMSLEDFKQQIVNGPISKSMLTLAGTSMPPLPDQDQLAVMGINAARHFAYDQTISAIDLYGAFIGNYTLLPAGKKRLDVTWSSVADTIMKGDIPLPMGSAVSYKLGQQLNGKTEYYWYEVGPFEVGSDQVGAYVPVWAFGSKFDKGKPVDGYQGKAPEYPISYYEGVFGSAFAASVNEVVDQKLVNPKFMLFDQKITVPVDTWIKNSLTETTRDSRMYPATFHNYTAGMSNSPIANAVDIRLYDGAMNINFPLPVLMRPARELDAIFVCDSGVDLASLRSAELHFKRNGQKFPNISKVTKKILAASPLTVLNDPRKEGYDKDIVTIFYCPFVKNTGYLADFDPEVCMSKGECATFNFKYEAQQSDRVVELMRYNVKQIQPEIKEVLQALQVAKTGIKLPVAPLIKEALQQAQAAVA
ncbi:hypothetical protein [Candidatus Chromulinivorax destructor]|uniref:PLA2c domain-containing protein n=1 Tax=Candidatus Chromulinivorax destructor TaxID=2066483 RepID=A0A345ZCI0_9BACT|nr:hypothetical protein [Candidatus Chromulinivorax destructor]AXK60997.1 hypothetical protein C0J27_04670 [Candidatus Chromulinivorax destructor]